MQTSPSGASAGAVALRDVMASDLAHFFAFQLDPEANYMAAFTAEDPTDRDAFMAHWARILADDTIIVKTVLVAGRVAGSIVSFVEFDKREVGYWIGKEFWGRGVATAALTQFLTIIRERPLYAHAVKDNAASLRVLQKCGFQITGEGTGYANARDAVVEEYELTLSAGPADQH